MNPCLSFFVFFLFPCAFSSFFVALFFRLTPPSARSLAQDLTFFLPIHEVAPFFFFPFPRISELLSSLIVESLMSLLSPLGTTTDL